MIFRLVYSTVFVIWCLNFKQGDAFLEDIREAVGEATDYLKGAVPYVTNLYKKIKQVQVSPQTSTLNSPYVEGSTCRSSPTR